MGTTAQTHLGLLPSCKGEGFLTLLVHPLSTRFRVADDDVRITIQVKTGVEVQRDVVLIMTNVDGKPSGEA